MDGLAEVWSPLLLEKKLAEGFWVPRHSAICAVWFATQVELAPGLWSPVLGRGIEATLQGMLPVFA